MSEDSNEGAPPEEPWYEFVMECYGPNLGTNYFYEKAATRAEARGPLETKASAFGYDPGAECRIIN